MEQIAFTTTYLQIFTIAQLPPEFQKKAFPQELLSFKLSTQTKQVQKKKILQEINDQCKASMFTLLYTLCTLPT